MKELERNPQPSAAEAALEPEITPPTNSNEGNKGNVAPEAAPTDADGNLGKPDKASAPTKNADGNLGKPDKASAPTENTPNNSQGKPSSD